MKVSLPYPAALDAFWILKPELKLHPQGDFVAALGLLGVVAILSEKRGTRSTGKVNERILRANDYADRQNGIPFNDTSH